MSRSRHPSTFDRRPGAPVDRNLSAIRIQESSQPARSQFLPIFVLVSIAQDASVRVALILALTILAPGIAAAQDAAPRLMDEPPFDVLTLDRANDSKVFKLYPVELPGRRVPEKPRPSDKIRVRLLDTGEEYDVAWQHIEKLELYEQMVLAEARRFVNAARLDDAYDTLEFLYQHYRDTPGLADVRQAFLYASSAAAFRQQKFDEALALLEELIALNPSYRANESSASLEQRLDAIADRLLAAQVNDGDYRAARTLLARLATQYKADNQPFATKWRAELTRMASEQLAIAKAHFEAARYVEAHDACSQALEIWPDLSGTKELAAEIGRRHPLVRVGVAQPALSHDPTSLNSSAARRAGRLVSRLLAERTALGLEGATYASPLGTFAASDDGASLVIRLRDPVDNWGYLLTEKFLALARSGSASFDASWNRLLAGVALVSPSEVRIDFRTPPILPEARLQWPLAELSPSIQPPYKLLSSDATRTRFAANPSSTALSQGQPAEIVERYFSDPQRALLALKRGEIDVLDQVFPGDIPLLAGDESLVVEACRGPTTHALAIRSAEPFLQSPTFRRALLYAANRELLLAQGILRGAALPGFRTVSSPFPAPVPGMELPTYAYDEYIDPRAYDPPLAKAMILLAENEIRSSVQKQEKQAPKRRELVLGHPADEVSRIACRGLAKDWKRIGVETRLVEFAPGVFDDTKQQCDLVYLQIAAWEPLLDAGRLLGPQGLTPSSSPAIQLLLREIESAPNWPEARRLLTTLHRLLHEDLAILPLWQTFDYYAYRRGTLPAGSRRLSMYQDIGQWRSSTSLARSKP